MLYRTYDVLINMKRIPLIPLGLMDAPLCLEVIKLYVSISVDNCDSEAVLCMRRLHDSINGLFLIHAVIWYQRNFQDMQIITKRS